MLFKIQNVIFVEYNVFIMDEPHRAEWNDFFFTMEKPQRPRFLVGV